MKRLIIAIIAIIVAAIGWKSKEIVMKKVIILLLGLIFVQCQPLDMDRKIREVAEYAYMEGQIDALHGDVRIKYTLDSCIMWTKSPWNDGSQPTYSRHICK